MSYPKSQQRRKLTPSESERIAKLIRGPQIARHPSNAAQLDRLENTLLFSWEDVKAAIAGFVEERRRSGGGPSAETVKNFYEDYKLYFESQGSTNLFHLKYSIPHDDRRVIVKNNFNDVSVLDTEIGKLATDEALDFITDRVMGGESYADAIAQLREFRGKTREEALKFLESIGERKSD